MNTSRRPLFWLTLSAVLIASIWWIFHVPYRPGRIFDAIPATATVVTVIEKPAEEWEPVLGNSLLRRVLKAVGINDEELAKLNANKGVRKWTEKLAGDKTVIAYVPLMGPEQKPALVAASWIGVHSRLLRWQLAWFKIKGLTPVYLDNGNLTIWLSRAKFGKTNLRLSLALSDGLVLACISEDPIGVRALLEAAENYPYRHTIASRGLPAKTQGLIHGTPRHWGWFEFDHKPVAFELALEPEYLQLDIYGMEGLPASTIITNVYGYERALGFIASRSDLAVLFPLSWVNSFIHQDPSLALLNAVREFAGTGNAPPHALAFVALLDQDYYGRVRGPMNKTMKALLSKGVKVPTLLAGLQIRNDAEADKRINQMLARLNSQYGVELVAGPFEPESGLRMTCIQDVHKSFYGSFELQERVAYAARGNWLIMASHGSTLKQLLSQQNLEEKAGWPGATATSSDAIAWANFEGMGQTLKNGVALAKLGTMLDSSGKAESRRTMLDQAGLVTAVLKELKQANLSVKSSPTGLRATLVIGQSR